MAVAQVGSISHGNAASGASVSVTLPNTATAGNLLIVLVSGSASGARTLTTPSGWTVDQTGSGSGTSTGVLWAMHKIAAGGETSVTVSWTGGNMTPGYRAIELSGADATTPVVSAPAFLVDTSAGATLTFGSARTTAAANEYTVAFAGGRGVTGGFNTHSFGGGMSEPDTTATGGIGVLNSGFRTDASSGTVFTPAFTFTNAQGSPVSIFGYLSIAAAVAGAFTGSAAVSATATIAASGTAGGSASVAATATIAAAGSTGLSRGASVAATVTISAAGTVTGSLVEAQLTYKVELDYSGSPFGTTFSAADLTTSAVAGMGFEPYTITWGRQDQFGSVNPTTVTGAFLNTDSRFTPGNAASGPNFRRGIRRRVSVTVAGQGTVTLAEDYAQSLEVVPANDTPAVTNIEGADILARFGGTPSTSDASALVVGTTLRSFLAEEMMLDTPSMFFMMQEGDGATSFGNLGFDALGSPLTVVNSRAGAGVVSAGQTPVGTFAGGTVVGLTNANYGTATRGGSWLATTRSLAGSPVTVEIWVQMPSTVPASVAARIVTGTNSTGTTQVDISVDTSGRITANSGDLTSSANLCDGRIHQIVAVFADGASVLYVDGVSVATGTMNPVPVFGFAMTVGMADDGLGGTNSFSGGVAYLAVYSGAKSSGRIAAHYNAGATAFAGLETTDARVTRLLSYRANTGSNLDTGLSLMGLQDITGRSLQDCLLETGQVEAGAVYVDGTGRVNMRSRSRAFNPAVTATFSMSAGGVNFGSNWREDTQSVINDVSITNQTTGSDQRFYNAASIALDGEFSTSVQLPVNSDGNALDIAGWMVANGTQQQLTATPLILDLLHLSPAQAYAALNLDPLDVIQLTNCPTPAPSSTMTFVVQGGTISLAADAATLTLNLTPLPPAVAVWDSTLWDATTGVWAF